MWQLDAIPDGLYRDEAFNGIDAVEVLAGNHALFFPANNGREPAYIYFTALNIAIWGQNTFAVRFAAALSGTLTTLFVYLLGKSWWNRNIGLLSAWIWATTVWTIHLSRIGLRPILLLPILTAAIWLVTEAYKKNRLSFWFLAGLVYGLGFYTYLAIRLTPGFAIIVLLWLWWSQRDRFPWRGLFVACIGLGISLIPWGYLVLNQPEILLGRTGQVSILHPDINGGNLIGALFESVWRSLALFIWEGDDIIRHNPSGRPLFDLAMAIPFLLGLFHCLRQWRQTASVAVLSWIGVMLLATILAEDPPHFLRAIGILPAALFLPALGLQQIANWFQSNIFVSRLLVSLLLLGSLGFTIQDYFVDYGRDLQTGYLFESAVRELALDANHQPDNTAVFVEKRFVDGWPSTSFLLEERENLTTLSSDVIPTVSPADEMAFYLWPHDPAVWRQVGQLVSSRYLVAAELGPLARGDLEPEAYPLYIRYQFSPISPELQSKAPVATYLNERGDRQELLLANGTMLAGNKLSLELSWRPDWDQDVPLITFVHVLDTTSGTLIAQSDSPPAYGYIPQAWWAQIDVLQETKQLALPRPLQETDQIFVGVYAADSPANPFVLADESAGSVWLFPHDKMNTD